MRTVGHAVNGQVWLDVNSEIPCRSSSLPMDVVMLSTWVPISRVSTPIIRAIRDVIVSIKRIVA